jgi:PLD-like domain
MTTQRDLLGPGQLRAIRDLLQDLFVGELIAPSKPLWLFFAWTSDVEVVDNTARQFAALYPDWPAARIRLSSVLEAIVNRGGTVNVLLRQHAHNETFRAALERLRRLYGDDAVRWCIRPDFHLKGMLGEGFLLTGSMNLTNRGLTVNDEDVVLRRDRETVATRRIELHHRWDEELA